MFFCNKKNYRRSCFRVKVCVALDTSSTLQMGQSNGNMKSDLLCLQHAIQSYKLNSAAVVLGSYYIDKDFWIRCLERKDVDGKSGKVLEVEQTKFFATSRFSILTFDESENLNSVIVKAEKYTDAQCSYAETSQYLRTTLAPLVLSERPRVGDLDRSSASATSTEKPATESSHIDANSFKAQFESIPLQPCSQESLLSQQIVSPLEDSDDEYPAIFESQQKRKQKST